MDMPPVNPSPGAGAPSLPNDIQLQHKFMADVATFMTDMEAVIANPSDPYATAAKKLCNDGVALQNDLTNLTKGSHADDQMAFNFNQSMGLSVQGQWNTLLGHCYTDQGSPWPGDVIQDLTGNPPNGFGTDACNQILGGLRQFLKSM